MIPVTVSVIIPAFNYGRFITRTIESLQAQTLTDWECLVVDDGSTDDTAQAVAAISATDTRVRYLYQRNSGPSATRNAGVRATTGMFVQFLDADDLIGPGKLERQVGILASRPEVDLVYGETRYFKDAAVDSARIEWDGRLSTVSGSQEPLLNALVRGNIMVIQAPLIRRRLLERVGGFDPEFRTVEDWECWIRCALSGAMFLHDSGAGPDCRSYVRVHGASVSNDREAMLRAAILVRRGIQDRLSPTLRQLNARRIHDEEASLGLREALGASPRAGARKLLHAGAAERNPKWLLLACAVPLLRLRPGRWAVESWRAFKERRLRSGGSPG